MNLRKEYRQLILPLIKAIPLLVLLVGTAIFIARRAVQYVTPKYRANGAIKINNLDYSLPAFELFGNENSAEHRQNENFLSEVEVFKSRQLIEKALENLDFEQDIFRVGELRLTELYTERPFELRLEQLRPNMYDKLFYLRYEGDHVFSLHEQKEAVDAGRMVVPEKLIRTNQFNIQLTLNQSFLSKKPQSLQHGDLFAFRINSKEQLLAHYGGAALFVKPIDKEISIIKIYFEHELPLKAQLFVNTLMETYISEGQRSRELQADATISYLDDRLDKVNYDLRQAEADRAKYRTKHGLINSIQETDAALRELSQLDLNKVQMDMRQAELQRLYNYLRSGNNLQDFSPNFDELQDPTFQETYRTIQRYELHKQDLLQKYAPNSEEIHHVDRKINNLRTFIHESVGSTLDNLEVKQTEITRAINKVNSSIKRYPEKERHLAQLDRDVQLNEQMYNYLMRKRTELAIAKSSNPIPHRIIDHALLPSDISSPNQFLIIGLAAFIALLTGMIIAYLYHFFTAKVQSKTDIEERMDQPIIAAVPKLKSGIHNEYALMSNLIANIKRVGKESPARGQWLAVTSLYPSEGKTFLSTHLGKAFAQSGKKVLLIDLDLYRPSVHSRLNLPNYGGVASILQKRKHALEAIIPTDIAGMDIIPAGELEPLQEALITSDITMNFLQDMRWHYDYIIIDTAPLGLSPDAAYVMHQSDINLFCVRAGKTHLRSLKRVKDVIAEYELPKVHLVLNESKNRVWIPAYRKMKRQYLNVQSKSAIA